MDESKYPMHRATANGDLDRVRQLIEGGMSVDSLDYRRWTPLHWAADWGRYEVAKLLIDRKCDLNLKDPDGRAPLWWAAIRNKKDVVDLLLQSGAQVNCTDDDESLLHLASRVGWTDVVCHILSKGEAELNIALRRGDTPLLLAAREGHDDVVSLLIRAGADVNLSGQWKETALHRAARNGRTRVVQLLLEEEDLDLNPQDEQGQTPLHEAFMWGCERQEIIKQLLEAGANANIRNNDGETVLSFSKCTQKWDIDYIRLFVQHGAVLPDCHYKISEDPILKENILKDVGLCTQSVANKFHGKSLPDELKIVSCIAGKFPNMDKFKLKAQQIDEVENLIKWEKEKYTFCNVFKTHSMALSAFCIISLIMIFLSLITWQSGRK